VDIGDQIELESQGGDQSSLISEQGENVTVVHESEGGRWWPKP
jgi:hypothetical protein